MISYVFPTRDRPAEVRRTLEAIAALGDHAAVGGAEVIIADNASREPLALPESIGPAGASIPVRVLRLSENRGAAARNAAVALADPRSAWIVMLDDDSHPMGTGLFAALAQAPDHVAAISADIWLEPGVRRESGGLPEVFIGCGVALRRRVFADLGGYDASFDYYVEEYDLAARLLAGGHSVRFDPRFTVHHRKVATHRNFGRIVRRLVRNNGWVQQRYAPESCRERELWETVRRYYSIARKERALPGYLRGLAELCTTLSAQRRTPMPEPLYDRLTGLHHARASLAAAVRSSERGVGLGRVAVVEPGKNAWCVRAALAELGVVPTEDVEFADTIVIGTLSPGPMLDALARWRERLPEAGGRRVIAPWLGAERSLPAAAARAAEAVLPAA
jgi:GT2 family glycosyltransferase